MKTRNQRWMTPIFGLALLFSIVLGALLLISHPVVWNPIHRHVMQEKLYEQGLNERQVEQVFADGADISGGLWNELPYQEISDQLDFRMLNAREVSHYQDVRELMQLAKIVALAAFSLAVIGFVAVGWRSVWSAGFASFLLLSVVFGIWMLINWHSLFKSLHWIVFQDASWKLPSGSYSLGLFPHKVWQFAGGAMGAVVGIVLIVGYLVARTKGRPQPE